MKVISVNMMRRLEAEAIACGTSGYELMCRAGEGAAALIREFAGKAFRRVVFLVGRGNNGGDALVAATHLGLPCVIYAVSPLTELRGEARLAARDLPDSIPVEIRERLTQTDFLPGDLIVDGLLGTGFSGGLREQFRNFIECAVASRLPIIALDLPSGIDGDSGEAVSGIAIEAVLTITFGFPKAGLFRRDARRCCGALRLVGLGLPEPEEAAFEAVFAADLLRDWPRTAWDAHKNLRGRVLVAAGSRSYPGAAELAARAALRAGAGMVRLASPALRSERLAAALIARGVSASPSGSFHAGSAGELADFLKASSAVVAGSGWGQSEEALPFLETLFEFPGSLLLDADALNLAARHPDVWRVRERLVITPHPGEAGRLAAGFGVACSEDRVKFARALAARLGAVTVLKGAHTVIAAPDGVFSINSSGSPALATAGSGDVLAGILGALLARMPEEPFKAAQLAVFLHGLAGETGGEGVIADDLPELLPGLIRRTLRGIL